jgi:DNA-cytosine methyltransferase
VYEVLDLFSGIGGFSLGLERTGGFKTAAFCEIEEFPRRVLKKHWPDVPIYKDVRELNAQRLADDGIIPDVITGGFPCQDISVAGKQGGIEAERSGLWSELCRLIGDIRPRFAIVENVSNLLSGPSEQRGGWFGKVLGDLAEIGFDAEWEVISAKDVGCPHLRERVWIVAYPNGPRSWSGSEVNGKLGRWHNTNDIGAASGIPRIQDVADTNWNDGGRGGCTQPQKWDARMEHGSGGERCTKPASAADVADTECSEYRRNPWKMDRESSRKEKAGDKSSFQTQCRSQDVADTESKRIQGHRPGWEQEPHAHAGKKISLCGSQRLRPADWDVEPVLGRDLLDGLSAWMDEPDIPRVGVGIPDRSKRLKGIGNAIVPQIATLIGQAILDVEIP